MVVRIVKLIGWGMCCTAISDWFAPFIEQQLNQVRLRFGIRLLLGIGLVFGLRIGLCDLQTRPAERTAV